jgi:capsular exopolysaccharide synthesis family protein
VAANLAIALSRAGRRVTLVDLDLRRPSLARQFRLSGGAGLTDVAVGSSKLEDALTTIGPKGGTLRVLTSGPTPPDAGEFCTTVALESILDDVRRTSDLVLVDCPPLLNLGDAIALSNKVDAILLVTRSGFLRRPALAELRRALFTCPAEKLGFVLTEASRDDWLANGGLS